MFGQKNRHQHTWNKWEVTDEGWRKSETEQVVGKYILQKRTCDGCGYSEVDRQEY